MLPTLRNNTRRQVDSVIGRIEDGWMSMRRRSGSVRCGGALKNWLIGPEKVIKIRLVTDGRGLDGRGRDRRGVPDELLQ